MAARQPGAPAAADCRLLRLGSSDWESRTVPGVFVHAAAIEEVMTGNLVRPLPLAGTAITAAIAGIAGALLGFFLSPWLAAGGIALLACAISGAALLALPMGVWFPVAIPAASAGGGTILAYVIRFVVEERQRRRVQRAFSHYLAPSIRRGFSLKARRMICALAANGATYRSCSPTSPASPPCPAASGRRR